MRNTGAYSTSIRLAALFDTFHSQQFIDWAKKQFAEVWQRRFSD